jgi:hypothetical protein
MNLGFRPCYASVPKFVPPISEDPTENVMKLNFALITLLATATVGMQAQNISHLSASKTPARPFNSLQASRSGAASETAPPSMRERVRDMQGTLAKMHAVLDQMRANSAVTSKDPLAKANLDMWELMVTHLDSELKDLRLAMVEREQWDARRAAMYQQADAKAQAEAQSAEKRTAGPQTPADSQPK